MEIIANFYIARSYEHNLRVYGMPLKNYTKNKQKNVYLYKLYDTI